MWFWYGLLLVVLGFLVLRCTTYSSSDDSSSEENSEIDLAQARKKLKKVIYLLIGNRLLV